MNYSPRRESKFLMTEMKKMGEKMTEMTELTEITDVTKNFHYKMAE